MSAMEAALRNKEEVKRYYQSSSAAGLAGSRELFALLAEDEERHGAAIRSLGSGGPARLDPSATLDKARFLLRRLSFRMASTRQMPQELEVYWRAMDLEAASAGAYNRLARESSGWQRELFLNIAAEEEIHFTLLEHMRELLDPAPEQFAGGREVAVDAF